MLTTKAATKNVFPRKAAAPRSPKVETVIFYKYRQNP